MKPENIKQRGWQRNSFRVMNKAFRVNMLWRARFYHADSLTHTIGLCSVVYLNKQSGVHRSETRGPILK